MPRAAALYTRLALDFRYIAIEGPIGVGKTALAERLAARLDATTVLEETENPFLADFYADRPGAALQAQLFYLLEPPPPAGDAAAGRSVQPGRRSATTCSRRTGSSRTSTSTTTSCSSTSGCTSCWRATCRRPISSSTCRRRPSAASSGCAAARRPSSSRYRPNPEYIAKLNEAYQHFFFHYSATPLLVVETSQLDLGGQRRGARRPAAPDPRHGPRHAVLRAADGRIEADRPRCS